MWRLIPAVAVGLACAAGAAHAQEKDKSEISWTVQAEDAPEKKPWTEPALIGFTSVSDGEDIFDIAIAVKGERPLSDKVGVFTSGALIRRTKPGKEQEFYAFKVGAGLTFSNAGAEVQTEEEARKAITLYVDPSLGLTRTTAFADPTAVCTPPAMATCQDQYETSLRAEVKAQLYLPALSRAPYKTDGQWRAKGGLAYDFGPTAAISFDQILDAKRDATGAKMEGSVTAGQLGLNGAVTPELFDFRLTLRGAARYFYAFDRSGERAAAYPRDATLWSASLTYEFGVRSFEGRKGWSPSFGIVYTNGEDPTTGRPDSEDVTVALKLTLVN